MFEKLELVGDPPGGPVGEPGGVGIDGGFVIETTTPEGSVLTGSFSGDFSPVSGQKVSNIEDGLCLWVFCGFYPPIGCTWAFIRVWTEASRKRTISYSLRSTSYQGLTSSCKGLVSGLGISIPIRAKEDFCLWFLVRLNGGFGGFSLWCMDNRMINLCWGRVVWRRTRKIKM